MSKEAVGYFNIKIGSSDYWSKLNHSTMLGTLMDAKTNYWDTLRAFGEKASAAIDEIYEDLSNLGTKIRFLPSSDRSALAKQVEELYDVCKMTGASAWHSSDCVQGLNLSAMSPWVNSFRDNRGIENAIRLIKSSPYSGSEVVSMLQEAAKWSISSAAGSSQEKELFLLALAQGKDGSFLQDVAEEYQNQTGWPHYEGSCGYAVGSRSYLAYIENLVFGASFSVFASPDYERLLRDAFRSIAEQLERDLDNAIRENDYITDETAAKLKDVASELNRCGVSTGSLTGKIEKLAWFVGGDPAKIKDLQRALNNLGIGQSLKEDGVYGEKTKEAIEQLIGKVSDFFNDPNRLRYASVAVDAIVAASVERSLNVRLIGAIKKEWRLFWNTIWDAGVTAYLKPKGYDVAALLLQHSLENSPSSLHFSQSHWVTQKIMASNGFKSKFADVEKTIKENPEIYAVNGSVDIDFQKYGDTDLYYGVGKCSLKYTCIRFPSYVLVKFSINDRYDFDHIRTFQVDANKLVTDFRIGNIANDLGLLSQKTNVISPYYIYIEFEKTIHLA